MGIWIRSQDKELLKEVNEFYIKELYQHKESKEYYNAIYSCDEKFDKVFMISNLGVYSTKEKAIKALDLIRNHIVGITKYINSNGDGFIVYDKDVFQMPLDEEVEL